MSWPSPTEFNEAVQSPHSSFADEELRRAQPATDALGLIRPYAGNFADVYQLTGTDSQCWAVKCFTRTVPDLHKRYQAISDHLQQGRLPFLVHFRYLAEGIRIGGQWYPIVKMPWIQGFTLNQFVRDNLDKPAHLDRLAKMWVKLAQQLRNVGAAHADLQHGNVLLVPNTKTGGLSLRLIDYDGMYVPSLARRPSGEVGHPNYQHPQRLREATYNAEIDRFAHLVIYTALRCLALPDGRTLWSRYDNSENLLFREQDFKTPQESKLFRELWRSKSPPIRALVGHLVLATQGPLLRVPLLDELVNDGLTQPLAGAQEQQIQRLLNEQAAAVAVPVTAAMLLGPPAAVAVPVTPTMLLDQPAAVAVPVTPAMLVEPMKGVLVSVTDTVALQPVSDGPPVAIPVGSSAERRNNAAPVAIPVNARNATPSLPRAIPVGQPAVNWKASLGPGAVIGVVIALGLLLAICISVVVLLTHPTGNGHQNSSPPTEVPPDTTPVLRAEQQRLPWPHPVSCMTVSADGNLLITGSDEAHPRVRVYDLTDGKLKQSFFGPRQAIRAVAWSSQGDRVLAVAGSAVYVWEVQSGQLLNGKPLVQEDVCCVALSPDGLLALSGAAKNGGLIRSWSMYAPNPPRIFSQGKGVHGVAFLSNEGRAVTACADGRLHFWNVQDGRMEEHDLVGSQAAATSVVVSADGKRLLSGDTEGLVRWWDVGSRQELKKLSGGKGVVRTLALAADGKLAAVSKSVPGAAADVRVFDLNTGQALYRVEAGRGEVSGLAVLSVRNMLVTGSADQTLRLWPLRTGMMMFPVPLEPTPPAPMFQDAVGYLKELAGLLEETALTANRIKDRSTVVVERLELAQLAERWTRFTALPAPSIDQQAAPLQPALQRYRIAEQLRQREASRLAALPECYAALAVLNLYNGKLK